MQIELPDLAMTEAEIRLELAVALFHQQKATAVKAAQVAQLPLVAFQQELARRQIPLHDDQRAYAEDVRTLQELGRLS
ncbi:MAG: UPF0175 family protein [Chloroflexota bacterium]|nr:UPF0175 family protein [Chloroflexota bacterium]